MIRIRGRRPKTKLRSGAVYREDALGLPARRKGGFPPEPEYVSKPSFSLRKYRRFSYDATSRPLRLVMVHAPSYRSMLSQFTADLLLARSNGL